MQKRGHCTPNTFFCKKKRLFENNVMPSIFSPSQHRININGRSCLFDSHFLATPAIVAKSMFIGGQKYEILHEAFFQPAQYSLGAHQKI